MKSTISQEQISKTAVRLGIPDVPFTHRRIARAFDLVATNKVNEVSHDDGFYRVHSQHDDKIYTVEVNHGKPSCTCPDGKKTVYCKHMIASMMMAFENEQNASKLMVKETPNPKVKASWVVVEDGRTYVNVWQDLNGKICCVCGAYYKRDCIHKQAIRDFYDGGNGSKIVNECGTSETKELQDKLNGNNGTGDNNPVHYQLDVTNPFEECELLDIEQIEGKRNGDLVHHLTNGEYIISYNGIMALAEQHKITFEASTHDETHTVIALGRCGSNSRASGKPANGSSTTAVELAKRNAARQLLPLPEIKAIQCKAKFEAEFDWQKAKAKCLELVPDFTFDILINDLVKAGRLKQKHSSDYSRKEWLVIYRACQLDVETNGDGANTPLPTDKFAECKAVANHDIRYSWLKDAMLKEGVVSDDWTDNDIAKLKSECKIDASLFDKELGHWTVEIQPNRGKWAYQRRWSFWLTPMSRRCFWCAETEGIMPDTFIHWGRYEIKSSLCLECSEKVGNGELDKDAIVQKFDTLYYKGYAPPLEPETRKAEVPDNVDEFIAKCREAEAMVDDSTDDNSVDESATATMVEGAQMGSDGKRMLRMDKKKNILLIEPDGTETPITMRDAAFTYGSNFILRLTQGIACGGDISTVELDN